MPNMTAEDLIKQLKESNQKGRNMDPGFELKLPPSKYPSIPMPQMEMGGKTEIDLGDGQKIPFGKRRPAKIRENGFMELKKGGKVSASSRADGCVTKGKTKGRFV